MRPWHKHAVRGVGIAALVLTGWLMAAPLAYAHGGHGGFHGGGFHHPGYYGPVGGYSNGYAPGYGSSYYYAPSYNLGYGGYGYGNYGYPSYATPYVNPYPYVPAFPSGYSYPNYGYGFGGNSGYCR